jgi:hypothetical protein
MLSALQLARYLQQSGSLRRNPATRNIGRPFSRRYLSRRSTLRELASATAVVSAVAAYAKINANGQWIERSEHVSLNELFDRMTPQEMEIYAKEGTVPTWFERALGATPPNSQGGSNVQ